MANIHSKQISKMWLEKVTKTNVIHSCALFVPFNETYGSIIPVGLALWFLAAAFLAAAVGQPESERCVLRLELTWPRPLHPGVGHFKIVSCNAKTIPPDSTFVSTDCLVKMFTLIHVRTNWIIIICIYNWKHVHLTTYLERSIYFK